MNKHTQKECREQTTSTTSASVTAKYCDGCQLMETGAVSGPITTKFLPVDVTVSAENMTVHPGECVVLNVTVSNRSEVVLTDPKFQLCSCNGIKVCELPNISEIRPGQTYDGRIVFKVESHAPSSCRVTICLLFCVNGCRCKACGEAMLFTVSRLVPGVKIHKVVEPACCLTPGMTAKVCLMVCNTGTVVLKELCVTDELPNGTAYLPNSTSIDGGNCFDADPRKGISLECLRAGESVKICYCIVAGNEKCSC